MIQVSDVLQELLTYADMKGYSQGDLYPCCERGLLWVQKRLKEGTDENDPLITHTAASIAHFYFFICRLTEPDKYESYKAGDMAVNRNIQKEMLVEKEMRSEAIAAASSILKDGGFGFIGT